MQFQLLASTHHSRNIKNKNLNAIHSVLAKTWTRIIYLYIKLIVKIALFKKHNINLATWFQNSRKNLKMKTSKKILCKDIWDSTSTKIVCFKSK